MTSFVSTTDGWLTYKGTLLHTTGGGSMWTTESLPPGGVTSMRFISPTFGWIVTGEGAVFTTSDGGVTWVEAH